MSAVNPYSPYILPLAGVMLFLAVQLFLCFNVKNIFVKLIPAILLVVSAVAFGMVAEPLDGWDRFAYGVLSVYSVVWLIACTVSWSIWAIVRFVNKKNK